MWMEFLVDWLMQEGGPVIQYRTARELMGNESADLEMAMLTSPLVVKWLANMRPELGFNQIHGAVPTTFENAMGKLTQLGCRAGMWLFDQKTEPFRKWFREVAGAPLTNEFHWQPFLRMVVAAFLARAGYWDEEVLQAYAAYRLDTICQICRQQRYDIFVDPAGYKSIPKVLDGRSLMDPALTAGGEYRIPTIYDMHLLASLPDKLLDVSTQEKVDTVIRYVQHSTYQALPEGYGIMQAGPRKYYAVGWSVHLPGYLGEIEAPFWRRAFLHRLALMSHFETAWQHDWFQKGVAFFEQFCTSGGRYIFPRQYLSEERSGCWVFGSYLGLESNRRTRSALALESSFWMLTILNRIGSSGF